MASFKTFEEMEAYKLARGLRKEISKFCRTLPEEDKYRLKDQMIRASRSITANIAEGFGRHHHQENAQFCRHSRGSLTETLDHFNCALDEGYMSEAEYKRLRSLLEETWKVLNGYVAYLQRCAGSGVPLHSSENSTTQQLHSPQGLRFGILARQTADMRTQNRECTRMHTNWELLTSRYIEITRSIDMMVLRANARQDGMGMRVQAQARMSLSHPRRLVPELSCSFLPVRRAGHHAL